MSFLRPVSKLILVAVLLCGFGSLAGAQQPASQRPSLSRMRVIENQPQSIPSQQSVSATYTVVGAVARSGVYASHENPLSIGRLIEVAGGLKVNAHPTLRVIRHRDVRFQVHFDSTGSGADDLLLPGDIVVVSTLPEHSDAASNMQQIIPVACVGLLDRPVVLPLDPTINTVDELVRRLIQPPELARSASVIEPARGVNPSLLVAGSVILFQPQLVDRVPLQQPGALPGVVELDQTRTSASPDVLPAYAVLPPDVPPAEVIQQASADMISPPGRRPAANHNHPVRSGIAESAIAVASAQTVEPSQQQQQQQQQQQPQQNSASMADPILPPFPADLEYAVSLFTKAEQQTAAATETPQIQQIALTDTSTDPESVSNSAQNSPTKPNRSTPPQGIDPQRGTISTVNDLAEDRTIIDARTPSDEKIATFSDLVMLGGGISILLGSCLVISLLLEKNKTGKENIGPVSLAALKGQETTSSTPTPTPTPTPAPTPATTSSSQIRDLLSRNVPVIEEPIVVPSLWPLHGKVVGHRRIIVNSAHDGVNAPHFTKRERNRDREQIAHGAAAERQLRNSLRDICRPLASEFNTEFDLGNSEELVKNPPSRREPLVGDQPEPPSSTSLPEVSETHPETLQSAPVEEQTPESPVASGPAVYDIVQPQYPANRSVMSPLERALRTLASEKRG